ncbi:hypothetical protein HJG60_009136 [Phyllostomus discolor]|uniref:Secreted protein n=1 Tax=Phyllostomus discolor TaxID=89673 RepID=A0A833YQG9_9CHIR|nr:hypothetical protein HJG60_009136 [Phyllostomus discolor]
MCKLSKYCSSIFLSVLFILVDTGRLAPWRSGWTANIRKVKMACTTVQKYCDDGYVLLLFFSPYSSSVVQNLGYLFIFKQLVVWATLWGWSRASWEVTVCGQGGQDCLACVIGVEGKKVPKPSLKTILPRCL